MNLFDQVAPATSATSATSATQSSNEIKLKPESQIFDNHPKVSDVFKTKADELVPVFSDSDYSGAEIIKSETITKNYNPKNTLYHIKNFCSAYLNFYSNLDELIKLDKDNTNNYNLRFTHPINEIKFDALEYAYIKIQEHLLSLYKYEEIDFKLYIVETESVLPIYDRLSIKDDKYYIQPDIENIVKRLILSKIIPAKEITVIEMLKTTQSEKECLNKIDMYGQMYRMGINDYQQCENCRFKIICLKTYHS